MNFKNIDFKSINISKVTDILVLGIAAVSASIGNTNVALLGIIIFLTSAVFTRDSK